MDDTNLRGELYNGKCGACDKPLHFLDGEDGRYWMVCDSCLLITCESGSQEKTLELWDRAVNAPLSNAVIARAKQLGVEVHDIRLSPVDPADLKGLVSIKNRP